MTDLKWGNIILLSLRHLGVLYCCGVVLPQSSWREFCCLFVGFWLSSGLGITAGAHRLWSHRSYQAVLPLRVFLMLMNCMAFQGSIYDWTRDHRIHHKNSETEGDPHNANRGFFFAHMGWLFVKKHPKVIEEGKKIDMSDILQDPVCVFQRRHYLPLALLMCYVVPTCTGWLLFDSVWKGFWIGGVLRSVWVLHCSGLVNSAAHFWGYKPYSPDINPTENLLVSICAIGEGWHNYHHKFPKDYATGEWGIMSGQWNPTKLFIDVCAAFGLAYDLKRSNKLAKKTRLALSHID